MESPSAASNAPWGSSPFDPVASSEESGLIKPRRLWHGLADVELGTAEWDDWFNTQRLHTSIGHIPPHEHETS
ncbi:MULTISPECIES: integrase core domain-containing protein [Streptomyces]|uniref:Integrase core domain-containing protein n=2 Tax=Streptomyces caniscabiei TaxID=2746961 RepID=A0ABU4N2D5_9ACTN|nr:integrase core domain-containing protein [Streptomyces caniscabiei]MDX2947877.1 integrase core domain-containing protein [Streptomyces caniscabiei]MDX2953285.1 integrase core domain-containing protein [Streptomyces caniscabiei]MDX2987379.1 integrase core domain-containing protein [Streptomyces caniscabiei]MDX3009484.1 integrase core domain-containing protein [Streptomyces caniscabiei]MDX3042679.1 integrase core domain-containing protein [Streptomyces caniscabiei]